MIEVFKSLFHLIRLLRFATDFVGTSASVTLSVVQIQFETLLLGHLTVLEDIDINHIDYLGLVDDNSYPLSVFSFRALTSFDDEIDLVTKRMEPHGFHQIRLRTKEDVLDAVYWSLRASFGRLILDGASILQERVSNRIGL